MFNLPSALVLCPLPRFHPFHPPYSLCPIFLLLVFEPSSSPPRLNLLYLSSHYFPVLFHFFQLIFGVSRSTFRLLWLSFCIFFFPSQCHRFHALHRSTFSDRGVCEERVYLPHSGWLAWRALALADHRASSACCSSHFPRGEMQKKKKKMKGKGTEPLQSFICRCCWRCTRHQS